MAEQIVDEEVPRHRPMYTPYTAKPVQVEHTRPNITLLPPLYAPLLIHNEQSEVRDFCANERTFLSYLRLATYLAIVATAIIMSFHLSEHPRQAERAAALPLGIVFWVLAGLAFTLGIWRYFAVVEGYGRRKAVVQSGLGTQIVLGVVGVVVFGSCVFFIVVDD